MGEPSPSASRPPWPAVRWYSPIVSTPVPCPAGSFVPTDVRARDIVSGALACLNGAVDAWTEWAGKKRLDVLLDTAFEAVSSKTGPVQTPSAGGYRVTSEADVMGECDRASGRRIG